MKLKKGLAKLLSFLMIFGMLVTCVPGSLTTALADEGEDNGVWLNEDTVVFTGSANDVDVEVTAYPGTFPVGTQMVVETVEKEEVADAVEEAMADKDAAAKDFRAVDITFIDEDGVEVQPLNSVEVVLTTEAFDEEADLSVVHVDGEETEVIEDASVSEDNTEVAFDADHFSVYIVVDEEVDSPDLNAIATYEFYVDGEVAQTQYIKSGDKLLDPGTLGVGDGANSVFKGWYVSAGQEIQGETPGAKLTFGTKTTVPKTETIKIEPKVETTYYITYLGEKDAQGGRGIAAVDTVVVNGPAETPGTLDISSRSITPKADTSVFEGWAESNSSTTVIEDTTITVTGHKTLYAVVVDANWIHFDENVTYPADSDPDYTGPVYVKKTESVSGKKPRDPSRQGYTFGGWYEDADCTEGKEFNWEKEEPGLDTDITLYAKWIPAQSGFAVIIWKQKVSDPKNAADSAKTYDFESSKGVEAQTGSTINLGDSQFDEFKTQTYTGFHYSRIEVEPEDAVVRADGTTVVNVYYDRNLLTIYFYDGAFAPEYQETDDTSGELYGLINEGTENEEYVRLTRHGTFSYTWTYQARQSYTGDRYRVTTDDDGEQYGFVNGQMVRIEQVSGGGCDGTYWRTVEGQERYSGTRYLKGTTTDSGVGIVNGEVVGISRDADDNTWYYTTDVSYTGQRYVLRNVPAPKYTFTGLYGSTLASNDYTWPTDRDWWDKQQSQPGQQSTRLTFLDAFKFEGLSGTSENDTILTQYGRDHSGNTAIRFYKQNIDNDNYPTTATNTVRARGDSTFTITEKYEGFTASRYRNDEHPGGMNGTAGTVATTSGLEIYFTRNKYKLTYISGDSTFEEVEGIPYEKELTGYEIAPDTEDAPTKKHHKFVGWYEDPQGVAPFNWNSTMPAANKVVYAKFVQVEYPVTLDANGGTVDGTQDESFNVKPLTVLDKDSLFQNTTWDNKHELVGWFFKNDDGTIGDVYDYAGVEGPVNLIAKWRIPGQISIVYDAGEGGSGAPTDDYLYATDSSVVLGAPPTTINEGYIFVGWQILDKDGQPYGMVQYVNNTFDITDDIIAEYSDVTKTGKVKIKAVYNKTNEGPFETTYIRWFKNDGKPCFHVDILSNPTGDLTTSTLLVNQAVPIQAAPKREGFTFLGWAKVAEADDIDLTQDLDADDIFIFYKDNKFYSDSACTKEAKEVAADNVIVNDRKYEALFAVWGETVSVRVTADTQTVPYTGQPQSYDYTKENAYKVEYKVGDGEWTTEAPSGVTLSEETKPTITGTAVDTYTGTVKVSIASSNPQLIVDPEHGSAQATATLIITKPTITITINGSSDTKAYNGSDQTSATTVTPSCTDSLFDASKFSYTGATTITKKDVGNYSAAIDTTKASYNDDNVDVTFVAGTAVTFNITKKPVTITINGSSDTKAYNGSDQTSATTVTPSCTDSLFDADKFSYTGATTITKKDVGNYTESIDTSKASYSDNNLEVTFVAGTAVTFNITKKSVTITINGSSDSKVYSGSAQTSGTTVTPSCSDSLFDADKFSYTGATTITKTDVGNYTESIDTGKASYSDNNLEVTFVAGTAVTFDITPLAVTVNITGHNATYPYDNTEHKVDGYDVSISDDRYTEADFEFTGTDEASRKDVGTTNMGMTKDDFTNKNDNFTVTFEVEDGYIEITEAQGKTVTVTAKNITIDYGDEVPELTANVEGLEEGDEIEYSISREEGTKPGTYAITVTGEETQGKYTVKFINGKLTILPGEYKFTKGDGQTWMKGSKKTADFEVTRSTHDDRAFKYYQDIEIDGKKVDKSQYKYEEGCVELYISAEYMEKLKVGDHTIKAIFEDGTAEAKFKVDEVKAPETGDNNSIALWISLMGIALLLAAAAFFVLRRKHANK